ncbi:MAG: ANTAR domain-containing protein [Clostridiales bacterium]|nr:ANTAR domain-containing protein [Clostridiales bacterium]
MSNIIIAFPKPEIAQSIKKILAQSGYRIFAICTTGAAALQQAQQMESGIIVCGSRFVDMYYSELLEYLPAQVQMLLVTSRTAMLDREDGMPNLVCLAMPLKVHELLETIRMMDDEAVRRRRVAHRSPKQRSAEEQAVLDEAKQVLIRRNGFSEEEAHRYIQKRSMDNGTGLVETAQMIVSLMG